MVLHVTHTHRPLRAGAPLPPAAETGLTDVNVNIDTDTILFTLQDGNAPTAFSATGFHALHIRTTPQNASVSTRTGVAAVTYVHKALQVNN